MKINLLKLSVFANGIFSSIAGISTLLMHSHLDHIMGITYPWWSFGAFLLIFGVLLTYIAKCELFKTALVKSIIIADILWVIGSIIVLATLEIPKSGIWIIAICGLVVGDFALFQWIGLKKHLKLN